MLKVGALIAVSYAARLIWPQEQVRDFLLYVGACAAIGSLFYIAGTLRDIYVRLGDMQHESHRRSSDRPAA